MPAAFDPNEQIPFDLPPPPLAGEPTLNEILAGLGYRTEEAGSGLYQKSIIEVASGRTVAVLSAHEASAAIRSGMLPDLTGAAPALVVRS